MLCFLAAAHVDEHSYMSIADSLLLDTGNVDCLFPRFFISLMMTQGRSPYMSRYKKSMSPSPRNPFQGKGRSLSGRSLIMQRYAPSLPQKQNGVMNAFKQACIIIIAGTILVSLLSAAIPPAPVSVRMAAPRPPAVAIGGGPGSLRNRTRGGVRSQSRVRTNKKPEDNRQSEQEHHWNADTLEQENNGIEDYETASSEESPSKLKLVEEISKTTKKQNAAADSVFGRTKDGEEHADEKLEKKKSVDTKIVSKGHVNMDAIVAEEMEGIDDKLKAKGGKKRVKKTITVRDGKIVPNNDKTNGDVQVVTKNAEKKETATAMISDSNDEAVSTDFTEEEKAMTDKDGAFGDIKEKTKVVNVDSASEEGGDNTTDGGDLAGKQAHDNMENEKVASKDVKDPLSKVEAENVNASLEYEGKKLVKVDDPSNSADDAADNPVAHNSRDESIGKTNGSGEVDDDIHEDSKDNEKNEIGGDKENESADSDAKDDDSKVSEDTSKAGSKDDPENPETKSLEMDAALEQRKRVALVVDASDSRGGREHRKGVAPKISHRDKIMI